MPLEQNNAADAMLPDRFSTKVSSNVLPSASLLVYGDEGTTNSPLTR